MNKPPIVEIKWIDCCTVSGWFTLQEAEDTKLMECISIGYIIAKNDEAVIIAQTIADQGDVGDITCIPTVSIQELKDLA